MTSRAVPPPTAQASLSLGQALKGAGKPVAAPLNVSLDFADAAGQGAVASFGFQNGAAEGGAISVGVPSGAGAFDLLAASFDGRQVWSVDQDGAVFTSSDATAKCDVSPIENALAAVSQLKGVSFTTLAGTGRRRMGLLAQDVEAVLPALVRTDSSGLKAVAYDEVIGILIEAVKALAEKVTRLEASPRL